MTDLLQAQAALPGSRGRKRLLRLSPRLDDAYGEWRLRRWNPADPRVQELERQLRAPDPPLDPQGGPPALLPPPRQGSPAASP